jgi:hypothetical protein
VVSSEAPTTAATVGGRDPVPEMFMTSSTRPSSQIAPSSSYFAPSPAK